MERREAALEKREREEALAKSITPQQRAQQEEAAATRDDLAHRSGALLDASQSESILLLYYGLVQSGVEDSPAVERATELMRVGRDKVFKVNTVARSIGPAGAFQC